ncbi:RNA-binding protein 27 [Thelohanellus kitauei]|uniref:RNA-binding protein 27 n=1 Tax=Thelohanellus kitauei TaxID=669202 RepID=A0A0C2N350_THEKT|nr:RNA-binding protein 27 [Thelohanellus kitauei]
MRVHALLPKILNFPRVTTFMHIVKVDKFKTWLTKALEPLCEADPSALAKYIVALLQKNKPVGELKDVCSEQLEVFLSDKTSEFVEMMFSTLDSRSYFESNTDEEVSTSEQALPEDDQPKETAIDWDQVYDEPEEPREDSHRETLEEPQIEDEPRIYKSNKPCFEFQAKGRCSRGRRCPYRHIPNNRLNDVMIGNLPLIPTGEVIRNIVKDEVFHQMLVQNQLAFNMAAGKDPKTKRDRKRKFQPKHLYTLPKSGQAAKSLVLRNVPHEIGTVQNVNQFFSKFGKVVNVVLCYENDPSSIMIEFSTLLEAKDAYESTDAIMGNRFIKIYYQKSAPSSVPEKHKVLANEDLVYVNPDYLEKTKELKKETEIKEKEIDAKKQFLIDKIDLEVKKLVSVIREPSLEQSNREKYLQTLKELLADKDRLANAGSARPSFKSSYRFNSKRPNHLDTRPSAITLFLNKFTNPNDILDHFSKYGKILFNKLENDNQLTVGFPNHFIASKAFSEAKNCLKDRVENIQWSDMSATDV